MAEWFDQSRYELNGISTRESVEFVASLVDDARHMARIDSPPREPVEMARIAKAAIGELFRDAPAATVLQAAGLSEPAMQRAIDGGRFDTVLRDLKAAEQIGMTKELPDGEALARNGIDAQARYDGRAMKIIEQAQAEGRELPQSPEKAEAAKQGLRAAEISLVSALQSQAPRAEVIEGVDHVLAAAHRYWQATTVVGRQINAANQQAPQQQAERPAGQQAQAAVTRTAGG